MYSPPFNPATPSPPRFSFPHTSYRDPSTPRYKGGAAQLAMPSSFGEQLETHKPSSTVWSFGSCTREQLDRRQVIQSRGTDGESCYLGEPLGDEILSDSRKRTSEAFSQSKARRFFTTPVLPSPGPGAYSLRPAHGKQLESTKPSQPVNKFGRARRDHRASLPQPASDSPGAVYRPRHEAFGKQVQSPRTSSPRFGFGTSSRFAKDTASNLPGPGHYSPCL